MGNFTTTKNTQKCINVCIYMGMLLGDTKKLQALESQTPVAKETSHRNRHKSYA